MTCREMSATDIAKRISQGDLVVYLSEEYGYRQWFWFMGTRTLGMLTLIWPMIRG